MARYCEQCDRQVKPVKTYEPNHVAHLLATVFLCGAWFPFWMLACVLSVLQGYQCPVCGKRV